MEVPECKIAASEAYLSTMRRQGEDMCSEALKSGDERAYWLWDMFRQDIAAATSRMRDIRMYHVRSASE